MVNSVVSQIFSLTFFRGIRLWTDYLPVHYIERPYILLSATLDQPCYFLLQIINRPSCYAPFSLIMDFPNSLYLRLGPKFLTWVLDAVIQCWGNFSLVYTLDHGHLISLCWQQVLNTNACKERSVYVQMISSIFFAVWAGYCINLLCMICEICPI